MKFIMVLLCFVGAIAQAGTWEEQNKKPGLLPPSENAVVVEEVAGGSWVVGAFPAVAVRIAHAGRFDLDDIGAPVTQCGGGGGTGDVGADIEHGEAGQW